MRNSLATESWVEASTFFKKVKQSFLAFVSIKKPSWFSFKGSFTTITSPTPNSHAAIVTATQTPFYDQYTCDSIVSETAFGSAHTG